MQVATLLFAALFTVALGHSRWDELGDYSFDKYILEYGKRYPTLEELQFRKSIFLSKLEEVTLHNKDPSQTYKLGINHLSDRTPEEFKKMRGYKRGRPSGSVAVSSYHMSGKNLPDAVDWRIKGVVTPVKDQGSCGSCWTFGTTETIESFSAIKTGRLQELSEQQILDCTPNVDQCGGTGGCGGGTPELAYAQIIKDGGIATEWRYPYTSHAGSNFQCKLNTSDIGPSIQITGYTALPTNIYDIVIDALANQGPLAINVDASSWGSYESGVFSGCNKTEIVIDHVVQLVGYGNDAKHGPYWLIRNSWTPNWGEDGYIRIQRSATVECGQDHSPSDGTGCNGGPPVVTVCGACGILYDVSYPTMK